ncbi:MAG: FkbM family methyltransferase [Nisaea sp.]|jgi:FkbM family methyltransferase|uniref:FkbM family methyltransferase n=1 Tax=Nisaea sp. TaxID=2024842 RepID=UPI001B2E3568|nr:FkbM family methyltransferase [Nisaea sp.]MBO6561037.1 FkbM family methyltransferase [Nisaea sp.]
MSDIVETPFGRFATDPRDRSVSQALRRHGEYGRSELEALEIFLQAARHVLVLGAHIGAMTVPIARRVERVTAIEANPRTFALLQRNIALNGLENVVLLNRAVGAGRGQIEFIDYVNFSGGSKVLPKHNLESYLDKDAQVISVECDTVDALFPDQSFDLVLMDIEGSEHAALQGMPNTLAKAATLGIEFIPHHLQNVSDIDVEEFLRPLSAFGTMYSPRLSRVERGDKIRELLQQMFEHDISDECLIFHKGPVMVGKKAL